MSFGLGGSQTSNIPESGIGGFFDSLLGSVHKVNEMRQDTEMRKIEVGTAQRAAAQQQLDQMTKIMKANSAMQTDPKMIAKVKQLAQVAGLPDPISMQPGQTVGADQEAPKDGAGIKGDFKPTNFGTPTLGKESVNMDIVAPPIQWNDLDPKSKEAILQATPGDQRNSMIGDIKVPDSVRTADPLLTGGNKTQVLKNFQQTMHDFNTGLASGSATAAQIQSVVADAAAVGIHPDQLIEMVQHDAKFSPETAMKLAKGHAEIMKMGSEVDKNKAISAMDKMITETKPEQIIAMIKQNQQRADAATENAATNRMGLGIKQEQADTAAFRAQTAAQTAVDTSLYHQQMADAATSRASTAQQTLNFNEGKQALVQLNTVSKMLNQDYLATQKAYYAALSAGADVEAPGDNGEPSLGDQMRALEAKKNDAMQQQMVTQNFVSQQGTNSYRQGSGFGASTITNPQQTQGAPSGPLQELKYNGVPYGVLNTDNNKFTPYAGAQIPPGGVPGAQKPNGQQQQPGAQQQQPQPQGQQQQPQGQQQQPKPPQDPHQKAVNSAGAAPKFMPEGLAEAFKTWSPEQQRQIMQSDKLIKGLDAQKTFAVRQYLRTLAPQNSEDHAKQQAVSKNMGNAPKPAAPVTPTDPWATVDQVSGRVPFVRGAGTDQLEAMQNAFTKKGQQATQSNPIGGGEPDVFSQIGKGVGAASSAIGGAAKGIGDALGNKPPSNVQPGAPEQAMQAKMAQAALPVVINELKRGVPITQVLMDMQKHGIEHDTAMRILQQIHGMTQQPAGGSEGTNPKQISGNLPSGLLEKVEDAESSGGRPQYEHSSAGAEGPFQFMPGTAKEYGVTKPYDIVDSARGAARYLAALGSEFHHDWAKAIAGYNAGGGAVEAAVRRYGGDWLAHMPKETQNYVAEIMVGQ